MNLKKVLIFNSFGSIGLPNSISNLVTEKTFPECRCGSVINLLEVIKESKINQEIFNNMKADDILKQGNVIYYAVKNKHNCENPLKYTAEIVEVDIDRKWYINSYDGKENIEYLDNIECVNEELNYWKPKY